MLTRNRFRIVLAILSLLAAIPLATLRADDKSEPLPKDPNNVYGQFDNGVKYIIRHNSNPPGKVSIYLHVKTGALNESASQNGLAHFIEHMSFNGSEHYKPGELMPLMNKMGMIFGADSNAHTNYWETVYKLTMPDTNAKTIDTGMTIMQDFASGTQFSDTEINSERGVILEESRSRKSAQERLQKKMFREVFPGTQLSIHDIIGDESQIKKFPRSEFVDYWNTWYRPENMTLIVVGDIKPDDIIAVAKEKLGTFKARGDKREPLKAGIADTQGSKAYLFTDPEQVAGEVALFSLQPSRGIIKTYDQFRTEIIDGLAEWIVNRRFDELVKKGGAPFRDASVGSEDFFHEAHFVNVQTEGEPADWNKMLDAAVAEVSRAIDHGFSAHELELAKTETLSGAERAVETESTRDSDGIVQRISAEIGTDQPIMSAPQQLDLIKKVLASATVDEVHKAFVASFKTKNYLYVLTMPEKGGPESKDSSTKLPSTDEILAAANSAWAKKTEAPAEQKLASSILASEPTPGAVASQDTDKDLDLTTVKFSNGVVMHHKFSNYKKDQIWIEMTLPGGTIEETADNKGISDVASLILAQPATSKFTSSQLRDMMTGKKVSVGGHIGLDALNVSVSGSPKDLPTGMQLAYAVLTEGVLEQSALDDWKKNELQELKRKKSNPEAQIIDAIAKTIYGGDIRLMPLTEEIVNRQERPAAEAWFKNIANHSAIEVAVVGDIQLKDATDLVAKYIGSLPTRTGKFTDYDNLRKVTRGAGPFTNVVNIQAIAPKAVVLAGCTSCDELDPARRPLSLATQILSDRMIDRIREKEQLVYSIGCQNVPGQGIHGTGIMIAFSECDPKNAGKLADTIVEMMKDFAAKGPTDDEVGISKKQMANQLDSQMKEPRFWLAQIAQLEYHQRPLSDIKALPGVFQTFTREQIQDAVKQYMTDENAVKVEIIPEAPTAAVPTTPTEPAPHETAPAGK